MSKKCPSQLDLEEQLRQSESRIQSQELRYLEDVKIYEGIIRQNHNLLSHKNSKYTYQRKIRHEGIIEAHKVFSLSSCTSEVNLRRKREIENFSSKLVANNSNSFIQKRNAGIVPEIPIEGSSSEDRGDLELKEQPVKPKRGRKRRRMSAVKRKPEKVKVKKAIHKRQTRRGKGRRRTRRD